MKIVRESKSESFRIPPPPKIEILADHGTLRLFSFRIPPCPPKIEILADLGTLRLFSFRIPPTPRKLKFRQIMAL